MKSRRIAELALLLLLTGSVEDCASTRAQDGGASSAGPGADVQLSTDDLGITHVYAKSDADALFGAGYAMARDRLFQMELTRRQARGTSAEVLGPALVKSDIGALAFDFARLGAADAARLLAERPDEMKLIVAWTAGVNARIAEVRAGTAPRPYGLGPGELDFVPADWTPDDAFAIGKLLAFGLSNTLDQDVLATALLRLAPDAMKKLPIHQPAFDISTTGAVATSTGPAAPPPSSARGAADRAQLSTLDALGPLRFLFAGGHSNNWAVDGAHSFNGKPLLAGDPHQPLTSPSRFWPVHMSSADAGGSLDVIGFAFVGTPLVELGHNARVGWTATTNFADVMDMWDVTVNDDGTAVALGDGSHPVVSRTVTLKVKGAADEDVVLQDVPGYGVLLPEGVLPLPRSFLVDGNAILFNWTGFRPTRELSGYLAMDRARTIDEWEAAAALIDVGAVNLVGADAQHIDYFVHAAVPDRGDPHGGPMPWRIQPGTSARTLWTGAMLGDDHLPRWRDPPRGYLVTANNDPWGFTADGNVENDAFYYGSYYANGMRAHRIEEMLLSRFASTGKMSRDDLEEMQRDTFSPMADAVVPLLAKAVSAVDTDPALAAYRGRTDLTALATALGAWDRRMERAAGAPVVFAALEWFAAKRAFGAAIPSALFGAIAEKSPPFLLGQLMNVLGARFVAADDFAPGGRSALLLGALDDTAAWLQTRFGTIDPTRFAWSDMNQALFQNAYGHALDSAGVAVDGSSDTVKVSEAPFFAASGAPRDVMHAQEVSLYRMAMSFGDDGVVEATVNFARGTGGDPDSPHFADREPDWVEAKSAPLAFRRADVEARTGARVTLPAGR